MIHSSLPPRTSEPKRSGLQRTHWLKRGTKPIPKVNVKRRQSEFARCYHSRARVRFVKSLPCFMCKALHPLFGFTPERDNAHTETGGTGRKAGYETIIPLCREHHRRFDEHRTPFDDERMRQAAKHCAGEVERAWRAYSGERE